MKVFSLSSKSPGHRAGLFVFRTPILQVWEGEVYSACLRGLPPPCVLRAAAILR